MSVLSELFQDIADAIRTKTGGTDTMVPASFPTEILSIVTGGISGGGEGDTSNLRIAEGSIQPNITGNFGKLTFTHGLGEKPDFILVYNNGSGTAGPYRGWAFGFSSKFTGMSVRSGYQLFIISEGHIFFNAPTTSNGMDELTTSEQNAGYICTPDDNTFTVGSSSGYQFAETGTVHWFAIAGMGGDYPNAEETTF